MYSDSNFSILAILICGFFFYFLPAIIGLRKRNSLAIFVLNLLLGVTGIGWVVALVWALKKEPLPNTPVLTDAEELEIEPKTNVQSVLVAIILIVLLISVGGMYYRYFSIPSATASQATEIPEAVSSTDEVITTRVSDNTREAANKTKSHNSSKKSFNVQTLLSCDSPENITSLYGAENIKKEKLYDYEDNFIGWKYLIFPNTINEAEVTFKHDLPIITVENKGSKWQFPGDIYVGMPLEQLVRRNGRDFQFYGFEWDYDGGIYSWNNGRLENTGIGVRLDAKEHPDVYANFMGEGPFSTNSESIEKLKIEVGSITIRKK